MSISFAPPIGNRAHLERLVALREKNIAHLEEDAAHYGALSVPLHLANQLEAEREHRRVILEALDHLPRPTPAAVFPADPLAVPPRENPFVGLGPFHERDIDRFFGRQQASADLVRLATKNRFAILLEHRSG